MLEEGRLFGVPIIISYVNNGVKRLQIYDIDNVPYIDFRKVVNDKPTKVGATFTLEEARFLYRDCKFDREESYIYTENRLLRLTPGEKSVKIIQEHYDKANNKFIINKINLNKDYIDKFKDKLKFAAFFAFSIRMFPL